jgi:putative ABC transport system permease protein
MWKFSEKLVPLVEGVIAAFESIFGNPMKSFLTTLGVIVGVASVILVVAVLDGLVSNIESQFDGLGSDVITIRAGKSTESELLGTFKKLTYRDFELLKVKSAEYVESISAAMNGFSLGAQVEYDGKSISTRAIGTDSSYKEVIKIFPAAGRFLKSSDDDRRSRVAFVGASVVRKLDLDDKVIGEFIRFNQEWFRIIGVAEGRGDLFGFDQDNYVIIPFSTLISIDTRQAENDIEIHFQPKKGIDIDEVTRYFTVLLRRAHNLDIASENNFEFVSSNNTKESFANIVSSVTIVAVVLAGISLLVGGVGIMNTMLISVVNRTREIGILKALGAPPKFIMIQFLSESLILSLFGGFAGVALGYILTLLISLSIPYLEEASVSFSVSFLAVSFTTIIGVAFGLDPALKASRMHPVDALRFE